VNAFRNQADCINVTVPGSIVEPERKSKELAHVARAGMGPDSRLFDY
jgi:hypothetical protein